MTNDLDRARAFIAKARWVFAKSVPQHPHEYSLRRWLEPALQADFDAFAALIAERGYRGPYWGATWTYLDVDAHKYWISRELHGDGLIVNRARLDSGQLRLEVNER
jgi:hypothetical protein